MDEELFKRMQEAAERFRTGESDFEAIMTPIGAAHLVRDDSDPRGFRIDFVGGASTGVVPVQEYPAAPNRPPGYPAPLPFLPNCVVVVDTTDQSVTWPEPPDPPGALEGLLRQSLDDGWQAVEAEPTDVKTAGPRHVLVKDGSERTLALDAHGGRTSLVLSERRLAPSSRQG